jgi:hypothetical protein
MRWYVKLFERLLKCMPFNRATDSNYLTFRLKLIKELYHKNMKTSMTGLVYSCLSTKPSPKRLTEHQFLEKDSMERGKHGKAIVMGKH